MKLDPSDIKKIAVFRALQLGDMLCAVPAFKALRNAYPTAEITLIGLPWAKSFVQRYSAYINRFIAFPGYEGLPEQPYNAESFAYFISAMQQEKFDLLLQMQGNGSIVNTMLQQLNAKNMAGFQKGSDKNNKGFFIQYPSGLHEVQRHLALMKALGIPAHDEQLEFPFTETDYKEYNSLFLPVDNKRYVCIHPGSRGMQRRWPPQLFAAIADYCIDKGYAVVVTGTADEYEITKELLKCAHHPLIDLTGKTSLGAIGLLIKNAFMLVANCTGVSHIAAAVQTPSVIISLDGEPERWGPLNKTLHTTIDWTKEQSLATVFRSVEEMIDRYGEKIAIAS